MGTEQGHDGLTDDLLRVVTVASLCVPVEGHDPAVQIGRDDHHRRVVEDVLEVGSGPNQLCLDFALDGKVFRALLDDGFFRLVQLPEQPGADMVDQPDMAWPGMFQLVPDGAAGRCRLDWAADSLIRSGNAAPETVRPAPGSDVLELIATGGKMARSGLGPLMRRSC